MELHMKQYNLPTYHFMHGAYIKESICDDLVSFFDNNPDRHNSGEVFGGCEEHSHKLIKDPLTKQSTDINLYADNPEDYVLLQDYIAELNNCVSLYEKRFERAKHMERYGILESINIQKYEPGEGFHKWHCERRGKTNMNRCLVFMTYLNDVPEGGTDFLYQDLSTPAEKGLTFIWPPDWTHTHKGHISDAHRKYIITGWFNYLK